MGLMRTHLSITVSSEGAKPSQLADRLADLGFMPAHGAHDFVYEWPDGADIDAILNFADRVHATLAGTGALFEMETV